MATMKAISGKSLLRKGDKSHLLREIIRTHQVIMADFRRTIGMPSSRLALMRLVATASDSVGVTDIARQLGINAAAVSRHVQEMQDDGLVRRRADPKNARRSYVKLSPKGQRVFREIHDRSHQLERALSSVVTPREAATAAAVLAKLRGFVEGE